MLFIIIIFTSLVIVIKPSFTISLIKFSPHQFYSFPTFHPFINLPCSQQILPLDLMATKLFFLLTFFMFFHSFKCDQIQDGFLSITCGGKLNFIDSSNISWVSDNAYTTRGNTTTVDQIPIRFFPDPTSRNCYRIPIQSLTSLILVRMTFVYKNYDGLANPPAFTVSLGTAISSTVDLKKSDPWTEEFVWVVNKEILSLCLNSVNSGWFFPVISSIEIRPLPQGAYNSSNGGLSGTLLRKHYRINCGYLKGAIRYPEDPYDRIWDGDEDFAPFRLSTTFDSQSLFNLSSIIEKPPLTILETARVLARKESLSYNLKLENTGNYFIILYFAGIIPLSPSFDVIINGDYDYSNYTLNSWEANALFFTKRQIESLNITLGYRNFYPLINGIEVYEFVEIPQESSSTTVSALQVIQQSTGLDFRWEDDPCFPTPWDHIWCEGNLVISLELSDINLRTISPTFGDLLDLRTLGLHNTSLSGEIQNLGGLWRLEKLNLSFNEITSFGTDLEDLFNLQILDLRNNSLQGNVPESLGELRNLHVLNLEYNELQGLLPESLNRENLDIMTYGNLCLSFYRTTCNEASRNITIETPQVTIVTKKKRNDTNHLAVMIICAIGGVILALSAVSLFVFLYTKKNRTEIPYTTRSRMDLKNWNNKARSFSYKEIKSATNNFKNVIGRGSFGSVFLGKLSDGKPVAVKVRFDKSQLGADSFVNEVNLLSQIRHQHLVSLEGFCYESKQQILVYEYLPGGSLADNLYGAYSKRVTLSWVRRLKIAVDAAKGLDYLHNGNEPRIIHRDVKSNNILLDEEMNAKVSDFGLSKQVTRTDASHVTTFIKGTTGYIDPEYYSTQRLTEKSDIYSFGVVLLELICGREPLTHSGSPDSFNLVLWAKPYLQAGAYEVVLDESIKGSYDEESMQKAALIASRSVERDPLMRPNISQVLTELKRAYSMQLSYLAGILS